VKSNPLATCLLMDAAARRQGKIIFGPVATL
jgi:hypothetical protein